MLGKPLGKNSKGQFTTEYMIVIAIALATIAFFLIYVFIYYSNYYGSSTSSKVSSVATTLTNEANYVTNEGIGSKTSFSLSVPDLTLLGSFFCGNYIKASYGAYSSIQYSKSKLEGVLPTTGGTYIVYAKYSGNDIVQIGLQADISYINYSYSINGNLLNYYLEFYGKNGLPTGSTAYNISVFSYTGQYINSTVSSSTNGEAASSIYLGQVPSTLLIYIFALGTNVVAPSCFQT